MADAIPYDPFPVFIMHYLKQYVDIRNHPDPFGQFRRPLNASVHNHNGHNGYHFLEHKKMYERIHYPQGKR
ncbi:hypothetical protein JW968_04015 [Candidatus Woesearchaeota archaeon]|nr:hypothetical protein [Candidatus Woesearchaeota archaeon]